MFLITGVVSRFPALNRLLSIKTPTPEFTKICLLELSKAVILLQKKIDAQEEELKKTKEIQIHLDKDLKKEVDEVLKTISAANDSIERPKKVTAQESWNGFGE